MQEASVPQVTAAEARERLMAFMAEVVAGLPHVRQRENAVLYVRGLVEHGGRKSLWPTLFRLGEDAARYESLQQFLADSPWEPSQLVRAAAERVYPHLGVAAWVVDDTGIPKDGTHSPGVKRQYSGTLGKIGNCQIAVSLHAVGERGTVPLGWALYLPEEWCEDLPRRRQAKIPTGITFQTKPELAAALCEQAASWGLAGAPVLADATYGDTTVFRTALTDRGQSYVVAVSPKLCVFGPESSFLAPEPTGRRGRPRHSFAPRQASQSIGDLAVALPAAAWVTLPCRTTPTGEVIRSRFALVRVVAAHLVTRDRLPPDHEWLIVEWPENKEAPTDFWLSNLPAEEEPEHLARLARLRWTIELDYRQLKGELGLDHYEGRSYMGFHHHCALVSCAHAFLTLERLDPKAQRPA